MSLYVSARNASDHKMIRIPEAIVIIRCVFTIVNLMLNFSIKVSECTLMYVLA